MLEKQLSEASSFNLYWARLFVHMALSWLIESQVFAAEPSFRVPEKNVTYIQGDTAVLECTIHNLKEHRVIWTDKSGFVLTLDQKRIIEDVRISVERPTVKDWNLHIQNVNYTDEGRYVCQINTTPVKERAVRLTVKVPPRILEHLSSPDSQTVLEGDTVVLFCNATGVPPPEMSWFRITSAYSNHREKIGEDGEVLRIKSVSRSCGGTYVCEADNGIGAKQARNMLIDVQYPPEVTLPNSKIGQYPGMETFLECKVTAHPLGELYWTRDGIDLTYMPKKYDVQMYNTDFDHSKTLSLRIKDLTQKDYGLYSCVAKNFLGEDKASMLLYDYTLRISTTTTTTERSLVVFPDRIFTTPVPHNPGTYYIKGHRDRDRTRDGKERKESNNANTGAVRGENSAFLSRPSVILLLFMIQLFRRLCNTESSL